MNTCRLYKNTEITGDTGYVSFNKEGSRLCVNYDLINIATNASEVVVGSYTCSYNASASDVQRNLSIADSEIVWPGKSTIKPAGVKFSKHLRVVTIQETPFVYAEKLKPGEECNSTQLNDMTNNASMKCPKYLDNGEFLQLRQYAF